MAHEEADKDAAVAAVFLLGRVLEVDEAERAADNLAQLAAGEVRLGPVSAAEGVVVEGDAVEDGDEKQGPVGAALGVGDVAVVVDGEEDVGDLGKIGQGAADLAHVVLAHEEKGHAGAEEDDAGLGVAGKRLVLEVFLPKGNVVVRQPVVLERLDVVDCKEDIVVAEVGLVIGGEELERREKIKRQSASNFFF